MKTYTTSEAGELLGKSTASIAQWCKGHGVGRNNDGHRSYIITEEEFQQIKNIPVPVKKEKLTMFKRITGGKRIDFQLERAKQKRLKGRQAELAEMYLNE